ncbi:MAG: putative salt-induced outer membrane protein YdiY [Gammaproteobacteria bacterium]|jgi:putative salt-induced outer membrane protein YdiY|tara:strand:+ start:29 stop:766 length:738 start_codon:yes stop_codon:yes gene_type:complete
MKKILYVVLTIVISPLVISQPIVSIESLRHSGEIGVFKSAGISFDGSRGNEERDEYEFNLSYTKNNENLESLFTFNKSERAKDNKIEGESLFFHARFLLKSDKKYNFEAYIQSSENPFQSYKKRDLLGFGLRFDAPNQYKIGLSLLQEKEESLLSINKSTERLNLYLYKEVLLQNTNYLSTSLFYQPSLNKFSSDYKASFLISLNMPISDKFIIELRFANVMDNDPPDISDKSNQSFSTNFRYKF